MEQEILTTLREIRFMLFVLTVVACIFMFFAILRVVIRVNKYFDDAKLDDFNRRANKLFEKAHLEKLIKQCKENLKDSPNDSTAIWWLARAKQELGAYDEARTLFEKLAQLQPDWRESHVEPYLRKIDIKQES